MKGWKIPTKLLPRKSTVCFKGTFEWSAVSCDISDTMLQRVIACDSSNIFISGAQNLSFIFLMRKAAEIDWNTIDFNTILEGAYIEILQYSSFDC
jgi:hypothetical protein